MLIDGQWHRLRARGHTDVPRIVEFYMGGKIQIDPMITQTMPLEDINKGFDPMHGKSIRSAWYTDRGSERRQASARRCQ